MNLTHDDVAEILRLLEGSDYDELQLETDRFRLTLRRGDSGQGWTRETNTLAEPVVISATADVPDSETDGSDTQVATGETPSAGIESGLIGIHSPLIGAFYRAPKPGAAPFVDIGSRVGQDTVIAIIEVMKLMNSVPAGVAGEIAEICIADGEFIEVGQVLMRVRPDES